MRAAALLVVAGLLGGCGGDDQDQVTVGAAASLTGAFEQCLPDAGARGTFGGSDDVAAQIREGVDIDVFAAANTDLPQQLADDGLAEQPQVFATNQLVLATRPDAGIEQLADLAGTKLVVGSDSVPVGAYTRKVLAGLPDGERQDIEDAIVSEEPDVEGIVGKIVSGAADAGFVYVTDVTAAGDDLTVAMRFAEPVEYGIAVIEDSDAARAVVDDVLSGGCADALREAGFGAP